MAYDGWIEFGGVELVNLSRTAQIAEALGIDTLWFDSSDYEWIATALGEDTYDITDAPWYDAGYPASAEFAGIVPLAITGMDDSTWETTTTEYVTAGGSSTGGRNKTLPLVANVSVVASTSRGAEYGKRWLDRVLRGGGSRRMCSGSDLRYFRFPQEDGLGTPPIAHRRDVSLSRGTSVTRKRANHCSSTWMVTFTWVANDPFEYGEEVVMFTDLGFATAPTSTRGVLSIVEEDCPVYDYSPLYDPLYPALVPGPNLPDFYPEGWSLVPGVTFDRFWVRVPPVEPSTVNVVPVVTLNTDVIARMVRVSIWGADSEPDDMCEPLWTGVVSYLPTGLAFVIDGEQSAAYAWDGVSPNVRRTDSLLYGTSARPILWSAFNDPDGLLITLDVVTGDYDGDGTVTLSLSLVPKSD